MKIALWCYSPVAVRAARVLAADPEVDAVGIYSGSQQIPREFPPVSASDLEDWDVLTTDGSLPKGSVDLPPRVVTSQYEPGPAVNGANLISGIAGSLAALELAHGGQVGVAYTVPGSVHRTGRRLRFPSPMRSLHGRAVAQAPLPGAVGEALEAASPGPWAGVLVWRSVAGTEERILGVADDRLFLEAIALAATSVAAGRGAYSDSPAVAYEAPADFVEAAVGSGLSVASYSSDSSGSDV